MTRGRAMFGVGPGSLVYDADKMGLAAEDQRRKLDESLDVIMELMQGRMVTKKTDWFDLREARLQLKSYSQPMMEMAVASARSPTGALQAGKHGIGMLSIGGTSDDALKAHASNWGVYEESARGQRQDARPPQVAHRHVRACGGDARAGARGREVRAGGLQALLQRSRDLPDHPAGRHRRPGRYLVSSGLACIGTPEDCVRHFERLWKGSNGGLGGILLLAHNWADWPATKRSYELMARYVHPHFQRNANALRDWSYDDAKGKYATAGAQMQKRGAGRDRQASGEESLRLGAPAIDRHDLAGDPARLFAREKQNRVRDVFRRPQPPRMDALDQPRLTFGAIALPLTLAWRDLSARSPARSHCR